NTETQRHREIFFNFTMQSAVIPTVHCYSRKTRAILFSLCLCVSVVKKSLRVLRASVVNALLSRRQYRLEVVLDHMEQVDTGRVSGDAVGLARIHHQFELLA